MNHDSKPLFDSTTSHCGEGPKLAGEQETLGALVRCYRVIVQGSFGSFFMNRTRLRSCIFTTLGLTEMRTNENEGDQTETNESAWYLVELGISMMPILGHSPDLLRHVEYLDCDSAQRRVSLCRAECTKQCSWPEVKNTERHEIETKLSSFECCYVRLVQVS